MKSPCLSKLHKAPKGQHTAYVSFTDNGTLPLLAETLDEFTNKAEVKQWGFASKALAKCKTLSFADNGKTLHATIGAMSFPKKGSASSAYSASFSVTAFSLGLDIVLFRTGPYDGAIFFLDLGSPTVTTVEGFVKAAVSKAEGHAVTVPTTAS